MKRMLGMLMAAMIAVLVIGLPARPAGAEPVANEAHFLALLNDLRADKGLKTLASDGQLVGVARRWSGVMAAESKLFHNDNLPNEVTNWRIIGENVGVGSDVKQLHDAFVASQHHYENMVEPAFDSVGIGVVEKDGQIWVTVDFKQTKTFATAAPAPKPAPAPRPAAAPRAAAAPKPAPKPAAPKPAPKPAAAPAAQPAPATTVAPATTTTVAPAPGPIDETQVAGAAFDRPAGDPTGPSAGLTLLATILLLAVARAVFRLRTA